MSTVEDVLAGGAGAFKFDDIGDTCRGRIVGAKTAQQTDVDTGEPKFFSNGDPMMQIVLTIETEDGEERALYAKGGRYEIEEGEGKSMLDALRDALQAANAKTIDEGGEIAIKFSGLGKKKKAAYSAPKLFKVKYTAPVAGVSVDEF